MSNDSTAPTARTPLYGHTSPETAYLVPDYPYGRTVRCRIRYWLEHDPKRGYRFCSQTEHPTKLVWNAPKKSTYSLLAAAMYRDENGHVQWTSLHEYSKHTDALDFIRTFPGAVTPRLKVWCIAKKRMNAQLASGERFMTMNGERMPYSEAARAEDLADAAGWDACLAAFPESVK